jgi:cytidylate kinase
MPIAARRPAADSTSAVGLTTSDRALARTIATMPARVVCISYATGSDGETVGVLVAETLGFRHVDDEIVRRAAEREGLDPAVIGDVERRRSFVQRMLDTLAEVASPETYPKLFGHSPTAETSFRELIREVIRDTADEGDVVIVSHAASLALAGTPDLLRVFVSASADVRARRLEGVDLLGFESARHRVRAEDAARADYLRRFYGAHEELPTHYDLVVSTDVLTVPQAATLVVTAARL